MSEKLKQYILDQRLDEEELEAINGGKLITDIKPDKMDNCTEDYYSRACAATVERGSLCLKNDWCLTVYVHYRQPRCLYLAAF